jgi:hypothetical protein
MKLIFAPALLLCLSISVKAQFVPPPPINLGIQNISQETLMWCWAAAAQQIIYWKTGMSLPQCNLVAQAKGAHPNVCCSNFQNCLVPGNFNDIQSLLFQNGAGYSSLSLPANPMILYNTLAANRAVILFLNKPFQNIGHFVVLTGMEWVNDPIYGLVPVVYINDPMAYYTQPLAFNNLIGLWQAAIVTN